MRIGIGYDIHRFGGDGPLILGGVEFDEEGLVAHSDGDLVMHAVADAVLGAAALGDIGDHFPPDDPEWEGVAGRVVVEESVRLARERRGLGPANVDVNVICERPRLGELKNAMRTRIAEALSLPVEAVSVKARTAEGLGAVGAGQAIEAQAVVLLRPL